MKRNLRHFFQNYFFNLLILFLPLFMLGIMGPSEVFFGNYNELGFIYQEFGWKFFAVFSLCAFAGALIVSVLPPKVQNYILAVIYGISVAGYIQTMFLNKHLAQMGESANAYSASLPKMLVNTALWIFIIAAALFLAARAKKIYRKILLLSGSILLGMQAIGYISLFITADESAFTYPSDEQLCLDGSDQFTLSSRDNIILLILDNFSTTYLADAAKTYPDLKEPLRDFTYYNNADCNYHGTYPSLAHLLTGYELDPSLSVNDWLEECWTNDTTNDFYSLLKEENYKVNLYTPITDMLTGTHSLTLLQDKFDNVAFQSNTIHIDYPKLYKTMLSMSCYRFMPECFKTPFDVNNETYTSIVTYTGNEIQHANYDFYNELVSSGISLDDSSNYFTIQHLNGTHEFTTSETCQFDENATSLTTVKGIYTMLDAYLKQLKDLGIYDNSTIIITSDHGNIDYPQMIFYIKGKNETHDAPSGTNAPITLDELVPTIVESLGKDYSAFGYSIHDFSEDEQRERTLYIRDRVDSFPIVPRYDGLTDARSNVYRVYTYTGNIDDQINALQNCIDTIPMVDSFF